MSEHVHTIALPGHLGLAPGLVEMRHEHPQKPEEPHRHTQRLTLHTDRVDTNGKASP